VGYKNPDLQRKFTREWMARRRQDWFQKNGPCRRCGSWLDLELDHIDPTKKVTHRVWSWKKEKREAELRKCQVLCYECHKKKSLEDHRKLVTHCPAGHPYNEENTYIHPGTNKRTCRPCGTHRKQEARLAGFR
jgi:hypothetical protein